jgi:hypothetical protein
MSRPVSTMSWHGAVSTTRGAIGLAMARAQAGPMSASVGTFMPMR